MKENVFERMERIDGQRKISDFIVKQKQDYEFKVKYATIRAREFAEECDRRELNYHVSVGGLDSITLFIFLKSIGIHAPGISVSYLENSSIQKIHKELGIERLKPSVRYVDSAGKEHRWTKQDIIQEFGFPVLSKEIAAKIELLANPTEKNKTVRHAIVTGETGAYGGYQKNSRMKMSQKWLEKFGGYANNEEGTNYQIPNFKVSSKCCYYLKEKPCNTWAKEHNSVPYLGLMASEGGRRAKSLMINGCNYFGKSTIRSAPFAIFNRQDILQLALDLNVPVPEIYGKSRGKKMVLCTQPKLKEQVAQCADLVCTWKSALIDLTYLKSKILKSGSIGCITAAQMIKQAKDTAGQGCWIISMLNINCNCKKIR